MNKTLLALILLAPVICQAKLITFAGGSGFTYFDHNRNPISKAGNAFFLTVDDHNPLAIYDLSLEIDGIGYHLDNSMTVNYSHRVPSQAGNSIPTLNASGYFRNTDGVTGFEWWLSLEFSNNELGASYKITDQSLENYFWFEAHDNNYLGTPFFREVKVPEPSSLALIGFGILALVIGRKSNNLQAKLNQ